VANGSLVCEDLIVVAAWGGLVTEEVDVLVGDAPGLLGLGLEVLEAVGLIPPGGEDVEGDLAANGEGQAEVGEALLEGGDKGLADLGGLVVGLEVVALLGGGVTADGADVDHAVAELDKGAALDRDVEVGDVVEAEVGELLVLVLADPADEAVGGKGLPQLEGRQAVLGEAEVEEGRNGNAGGLAELLFLLLQVGAADEANGALLTELLEDVESLDRGAQPSRSKRAVDVEEADGVLERTLLEGRVGGKRHDCCRYGGEWYNKAERRCAKDVPLCD
jgi:hypothetical protein